MVPLRKHMLFNCIGRPKNANFPMTHPVFGVSTVTALSPVSSVFARRCATVSTVLATLSANWSCSEEFSAWAVSDSYGEHVCAKYDQATSKGRGKISLDNTLVSKWLEMLGSESTQEKRNTLRCVAWDCYRERMKLCTEYEQKKARYEEN